MAHARWRTPLLACLIALMLQGGLLIAFATAGSWRAPGAFLAGIGVPHLAQAAVHDRDAHPAQGQDVRNDDENDEVEQHYGYIINRPDGSVGTWVISKTHPAPETVSFSATESTVVADELEVGDCVLVEVGADAPTVAQKIDKKDAAHCVGDDDYEWLKGIVNSRPVGKVGMWVIKGVEYSATDSTLVEGDIRAGECVEVKVLKSQPKVAVRIAEKDAAQCNDDDDDSDDDEPEFRREWEGTIVSLPPLLMGEWVIAIGESKRLTFTTNAQTRFDPELATSYAVGLWVEVKVQRLLDGRVVAERVRVDDYEFGEIVVRLESAAISETIATKYNLVLTSTLLNQANIYLFTTTHDDERFLAAQIAREEGVIWAEVNYVNGVPEDDGYKTWGWGGKSEPDAYLGQSAYPQIRMGQATQAYQGDGVVVAVLDTGIYTPHEQFVDKLILPSLDVIDDDTGASEEAAGLAWGHGTHVAGVIAAMAPQAKILPVRVLDENGRGNTFLLAYAIEWVTQQPGVKVINLSLGTEFDSKILRDVIENAIQRGIIVVAAAGNNGTTQIQYPAGYQGVVSVTAVDENSLKASFANYGVGWVDVAAPGVGIMSTMINEDGPGYATWSGTSMATAFVSGAAALVAEKWDVETATNRGLLDQLTETGLVVDALNPLYAGQIGRQLDVSAALDVEADLLYMPKSFK